MKTSFTSRYLGLALSLMLPIQALHSEGPGIASDQYLQTTKQVQAAIRHLEEGRLKDAKTAFEACLKQIPDHYQAHFYLAQLAYENKDFSVALEHIRTSIRSLEGLNFTYRKQSEDVRKHIEKKRQDLHFILLSSLGNTAERGCRLQTLTAEVNGINRELDVLESHASAAREGPEIPPVFHFVHGNCLLRLKQNAEAREQYELAVKGDSTFSGAWNNLVFLWFSDKNLPRALETIRQAESHGAVIGAPLKQAVLDSSARQ